MSIISDLEDRVMAVLHGHQHRDLSHDDTWLMVVRESDMLFVSWPVPVPAVRALVPAGLEIDEFDGSAWVTIEALHMDIVRVRNLPLPRPIAGVEVNVRTYVRRRGTRGVYFLSLDAPGAIGNTLNRLLFNLPFRTADVRLELKGDNYHVESTRRNHGGPPVAFAASARIMGGPRAVAPGSVDEFLLTQTTLFGADARGHLFRGDVAHRPRVIHPVEGLVEANTLTSAAGVPVPAAAPLIHYSPGDDSLSWSFERLDD
jgi:uncharacterized protein YqjF (DUF2071 family)